MAGAAREIIVAALADQDVVAGLAIELVVAGAAEQHVVAIAAEQPVMTRLAMDDIVAVAAHQRVVAAAAEDQVVVLAAIDDVVAAKGGDDVGARRADDDVGSVGALDLVRRPVEKGQQRAIGNAAAAVRHGIAEGDLAERAALGRIEPHAVGIGAHRTGRDRQIGDRQPVTVGIERVGEQIVEQHDRRQVHEAVGKDVAAGDHRQPVGAGAAVVVIVVVVIAVIATA